MNLFSARRLFQRTTGFLPASVPFSEPCPLGLFFSRPAAVMPHYRPGSLNTGVVASPGVVTLAEAPKGGRPLCLSVTSQKLVGKQKPRINRALGVTLYQAPPAAKARRRPSNQVPVSALSPFGETLRDRQRCADVCLGPRQYQLAVFLRIQ